jgi:hypothetical protein
VIRHAFRVLLISVVATAVLHAQAPTRRLTTIDALKHFPGYYHLQNILVRGEFSTEGTRVVLRADEQEVRVLLDEGVSAPQGMADARGLLIDVGRLEPGDPRVGSVGEGREADKWPRPGEELLLRVSAVSNPAPSSGASVRSISIEPWRFDGQTVTILGNFRGRNLFGDLPGAPGKSRYDFVLRGTEGALWVTDLRPKGQGFDFDVNRRLDTDQWIEVTGVVAREKGLVTMKAARVVLAKAPKTVAAVDEPTPPPIPLLPVEVVFNAPTDRETDVSPAAPIRIQFSRGLREATLDGRVRLSYLGQTAEPNSPGLQFKVSYDAANRAIQITLARPLESYRTVRVELLEGITGFDGAPVKPWTLTFSVGG